MTVPVPVQVGIGRAALEAVRAGAGAVSGVGSGIVSGAGEVLDTARGAVKAGQWLSNPHNWVRIVYVAGGVALILVSAGMLVQRSAPGVVAPVAKAVLSKGV